MNSGPKQAAAQPRDGLPADDFLPTPEEDKFDRLPQWQAEEGEEAAAEETLLLTIEEEAEVQPSGSVWPWLFGGALILVALAWVGFSLWVFLNRPFGSDPAAIMNVVALVCTPLMLLGIAWLVLGQSPGRRAARFRRAVEQMRSESQALESVLEIVARKLEENHARLTSEATRLMSLGDEASDRLGRVAHYLAKESNQLDKQAEALESAAANAKVDIGVLLHDLPRATEQARGVATAMREAGLSAHEQAGALEGQLTALTARSREADEVVGGAAQRLGAHLARVESTATSASDKLDEATLGMTAAIDGAMARAAEAIDQARAGLDAQGAAMLATVEQGRAAMAEAGDEAARTLGQRLERIGVKIEGLAGQIASQDEASKALVSRLSADLTDLDQRFAALRESGIGGAGHLQDSFSNVRGLAQTLIEDLGSGHERAGALLARMEALSQGIGAVSGQLQGEVPAALEKVEVQALRTRTTANGIVPELDAIQASVDGAVARLSEAEASVNRQRATLETMIRGMSQQFSAFASTIGMIEERGVGGADKLKEAFAAVGESASRLLGDLGTGEERAGALTDRFAEIRRSLTSLHEEFEAPVADALGRVEEQAGRTHGAISQIVPTLAAIETSAGSALERLGDSEASVTRQRDAVDQLLGRLDEGGAGAEERLRALTAAAGEAQEAAADLTRTTGPELVEALLRVREAAAQATERAKEAISSVIPDSAAAMADAARDAIGGAVSGSVEQQMEELVKVAEVAVETARKASERLTRQLVTIGETAAAVEERFDEARRDHEERERETLSRHVSLLTESLNSAAIDVTKILSNEVTDSAWTAYLKGDRGVFTRRAVRLLGNTEAREILRHYEEEPDFREHVNRYIHDFEAMMRRVLADRDGSPLGVTILSSDMGKLYVALAQAIERLRR